MKHLLTISALLVSSLAMGQMPYNPDSNGDDLIGATDLISVLGLYNTLMVDSSLTCDYQGTELESWVGGLFDGTLVLDSVYVEYFYSGSVVTYLPGCPDPVLIETVLDRGYMLKNINYYDFSSYDQWRAGSDYLGFSRAFRLRFYDDGHYYLFLEDYEIEELTPYGYVSSWADGTNSFVPLPFPENWTLNEDGIQVDWTDNSWVNACEHFRLIPYWSEAE
jgi:hypothetical protein